MNSGRLNAKIVLVVAGIFLVGCSGPAKEVLQLADKTAANVGTISAHLRQLSQNSREMAGLRADSIARLHDRMGARQTQPGALIHRPAVGWLA